MTFLTMHIPRQQVVIKLLSEQAQHRLARERILLAVTQMSTKNRLMNQEFHLQRSETLAEAL